MSDIMAITRSALHVALAVPNLSAARDFFIDAPGFAQVGDIPDHGFIPFPADTFEKDWSSPDLTDIAPDRWSTPRFTDANKQLYSFLNRREWAGTAIQLFRKSWDGR